ncbi:hypothetical protein D3C78_955780 [compost metagenome]
MGVVIEVAAGVGQLGVVEQALERAALGRLAQHAVDLGDAGVAAGLQGDVEARHVDRRHAHRLGLDPSGQFGEQALDATGQAGRHRDHRLERRAGAAQVLVVVGVDHRLVVHRRVDGGDGHVVQADGLVEHLEQRHAAVGGAGGVGQQALGTAEAGLIDSVDDGGVDVVLAGHRLGEQHPRRTGFDEALGVGTGLVDAGAFQHQIDAQRRPVNALRRRLAQHLHAVAVDVQAVAGHLHLAGEAAVGGVEAGQVLDAGLVGQVVERDDFQPGIRATFVERTQHATADAAVAVEGDFVGAVGHGCSLLGWAGGKPRCGFPPYRDSIWHLKPSKKSSRAKTGRVTPGAGTATY